MVVDEVVHLGGVVAELRFVEDLDVHGVVGVVEVDDVDVEHQHSGGGDDVTWTEHKHT